MMNSNAKGEKDDPEWYSLFKIGGAAALIAGMFFVPYVGGISHSPDESTHRADCINAANVLLHTVVELASTS